MVMGNERHVPVDWGKYVILSDIVQDPRGHLVRKLRKQRVFQEFKPSVPIARIPTESVKSAAQACAEAHKLRNPACDSKELHRWEVILDL